jgi:hypothetical protein
MTENNYCDKTVGGMRAEGELILRFTSVAIAPLMWGRALALLTAARAGLKACPTVAIERIAE